MLEQPFRAHLLNSTALVTSHEARRAGFLSAVLEKSRLGDPFVDQAKTLRIKASKAKTAKQLLEIEDIRKGLLTAAGVSDKAIKHITSDDQIAIVNEFIEKVLLPAGESFIDELVYRFLLIRGDTLGGKMRNVAGIWAQRRLTRFILSELALSQREYLWLTSRSKKWETDSADDETSKVRGLHWKSTHGSRVLLYNLKLPFIRTEEEEDKEGKGKNVDICLFDCEPEKYFTQKTQLISSLGSYIVVGELKGGIDPAGADEHWKTAKSALERIRTPFNFLETRPHVVFVAAAIEHSMAGEIWTMLSNGFLSNAANLTKDEQMVSLASWLCNL